jgi:hypothetical protein
MTAPLAPCGHLGVRVIGSYVQCPTCDAMPNRDEIDPSRFIMCPSPSCRTLDVVKMSNGWWKCNQCALKFVPTRGNQP